EHPGGAGDEPRRRRRGGGRGPRGARGRGRGGGGGGGGRARRRRRVTPASPAAPAGPALADLQDAAAGLAGVAVRTSVVDAPFLAAVAGVPVALKCEFEQPMGAFKARGAYTALRRMDPAARARGVITYSSGNHGQAVAWAARMFGVRAVVVMPET